MWHESTNTTGISRLGRDCTRLGPGEVSPPGRAIVWRAGGDHPLMSVAITVSDLGKRYQLGGDSVPDPSGRPRSRAPRPVPTIRGFVSRGGSRDRP